MPLTRWDIDESPAGGHVDGIGQPAFLIIKVLLEMPTEAHHRLKNGPMPMDGVHRSRFNRIQHALGLILYL